jgi:two-component system C4-dicarboxylate transport response regulator DctD
LKKPPNEPGYVLIVDEEGQLRAQIGFLREEGAEVQVALSEADAVEIIAIHPPDTIICDLDSSCMKDFSFLLELHARDPQIPIIITTAHEDLHLVHQALVNGAFDCVKRNMIDAAPLINAIRRARDLNQAPSLVQSTPSSAPAY